MITWYQYTQTIKQMTYFLRALYVPLQLEASLVIADEGQ